MGANGDTYANIYIDNMMDVYNDNLKKWEI
jgi:hypothetical protein